MATFITCWACFGALAFALPSGTPSRSSEPVEVQDDLVEGPQLWEGCWSSNLELFDTMDCMLSNIENSEALLTPRVERIQQARRMEDCFAACEAEVSTDTDRATCRLQCTAPLRSETLALLETLQEQSSVPPEAAEVAVIPGYPDYPPER